MSGLPSSGKQWFPGQSGRSHALQGVMETPKYRTTGRMIFLADIPGITPVFQVIRQFMETTHPFVCRQHDLEQYKECMRQTVDDGSIQQQMIFSILLTGRTAGDHGDMSTLIHFQR